MTTSSAALAGLLTAGRNRTPCVLATVVRTLGSAYLGVGARMVVHADGTTAGMVSGGCLEADLAARAGGVLVAGTPQVVLYDARSPDDLVWGLGLGCEGLIEVLLEPLMPDEAASLAGFLERCVADGGPTVVATVYRAPAGRGFPAVGARSALGPSGVTTTSGDWGASTAFREMARECGIVEEPAGSTRGWSREFEDSGLAIAFEIVQPPVHLVICGTGPDAALVARLAHDLGWHCTVVSHQSPDASGIRSRFPHAALFQSLGEDRLHDVLIAGHRAAAIIMSHRYERDLRYLEVLLGTAVPYIGVLGPGRRTNRMLDELVLDSGPAGAGARGRVHGPAGLDIGGEGPELIALAIVAEVAAEMHGRGGGHLRDRTAPIHEVADGGGGGIASATPRSEGSAPMAASLEDRR